MLTVKELREILSAMNPDDVIVMSSDPEGNSYDYVSKNCVAEVIFRPERYGGEVVSPDEQEDGDIRAVCFWPG